MDAGLGLTLGEGYLAYLSHLLRIRGVDVLPKVRILHVLAKARLLFVKLGAALRSGCRPAYDRG